jgi:hypothetical protein
MTSHKKTRNSVPQTTQEERGTSQIYCTIINLVAFNDNKNQTFGLFVCSTQILAQFIIARAGVTFCTIKFSISYEGISDKKFTTVSKVAIMLAEYQEWISSLSRNMLSYLF